MIWEVEVFFWLGQNRFKLDKRIFYDIIIARKFGFYIEN